MQVLDIATARRPGFTYTLQVRRFTENITHHERFIYRVVTTDTANIETMYTNTSNDKKYASI